jgi:arsenate reductase
MDEGSRNGGSQEMLTRVLFVCSRNAGRSQMAEGIARVLLPHCEVFSAGERPSEISPVAIRVMAERGIDISSQYSKGVGDIPPGEFDVLVILGRWENPDRLPRARRVIQEILPDPRDLSGSPGEVEEGFRRVRDILWDRIGVWEKEGVFHVE